MTTVQEVIQKGVRYWSQEYGFRCSDGYYKDVFDRGFVMVNEYGKPVRALWASTDVSQINSMKDKVLISERMASIGQMVAGVAHELKNPLAVMRGFAQGYLRGRTSEEDTHQTMTAIERESARCQQLVQKLLHFSWGSHVDRRWTSLAEVIDQALTLFEAQALVHNIRLERELSRDLPAVLADGNQIQQIVINLCANAVDAMPQGGRIKVILDQADGTEPALAGAVRLRVIDEGQGMPTEIQKKIFEPFFTTKEPGKGTGLGLGIVSDIVKEHGGRLDVESRIGAGSTFIIWFPTHPQPSALTAA